MERNNMFTMLMNRPDVREASLLSILKAQKMPNWRKNNAPDQKLIVVGSEWIIRSHNDLTLLPQAFTWDDQQCRNFQFLNIIEDILSDRLKNCSLTDHSTSGRYERSDRSDRGYRRSPSPYYERSYRSNRRGYDRSRSRSYSPRKQWLDSLTFITFDGYLK